MNNKKYHIPSEIQPLISCSSNPYVFVFQISLNYIRIHKRTLESIFNAKNVILHPI